MERPAPSDQEIAAIFAGTLEATRTGVLVVDREGRIVIRNRRVAEMFGPAADALDSGLAAFDAALAPLLLDPVPPLADPGHRSRDQTAAATEVLRLNDGRVYERFVCSYFVKGAIAGQLVTFSDITRTVRAEAALLEERAFLEKAQEVAHIGSWAVDIDPNGVLQWSNEMYRILGLPLEQTTSRSQAQEFVHPNDRDLMHRTRAAAIAAGQPYELEHRILRPDGVVRWVHTKANILRNAEGRPVRVVGTMQDVTLRRELEEQLRQSQKLEAVGRLAGGVAHDLNNALTTVIGYTELVLDSVTADHPLSRDIVEIRRAAERAESVIRQLLAFSRRQFAEPRVFQLEESVREIGRMLERLLAPGVSVRTETAANLPPIYGDPGQIEQAIMNLALNARDAMLDGGAFTLKVSLVDIDARPVRSRPDHAHGQYLELLATDTGEGMSGETLTHIFEPFFTTKDVGKGTGLGLSMVYGTVQQVGGFIDVESEPQKGTTFRLYFPPARERAEAPPPPPPVPVVPHLATILVVDDQAAIRDLAIATLRRAGYRVLSAASGKEALALAGARGARLDVLLTDATMPGMNGRELAELLVKIHPGLRVIIMSGYSAATLGLSGLPDTHVILPKPFTQATLKEKIRELLSVEPQKGV